MLDAETLLVLTLAYMAGLAAVLFLGRLRRPGAPAEEYGRRILAYENMIVDLVVRLDTLEMRTQRGAGGMSQPPVTSQPRDAGHSPAPGRTLAQDASGMVECVLKLLVEGPKTSRQIEALIGRSREHTARLMKRLFETGHVARDSASKPYTYTITDGGRTVVQGIQVSA